MEEIIVSQEAGKIICDFGKAKEALSKELEIYQGLVFTEETKKEAKETVANLRKCKKAFADKCRDIKKEYTKPLDDFMERAGELSDMFDKPIVFIDEQIKAFETKRKEEKKIQISDTYDELVPEENLRQFMPLSKIYNSRWENDTFSFKDIKAEILNKKAVVKNGLEIIESMHSDVETRALEVFSVTYDLTEALSVITRYENEKAEILKREQEAIRIKEEERIRREERERVAAEQKKDEEIQIAKETAKEEVISSLMPKVEEEVEEKVYVYNIFLSDDAKEKLETYMNSVGIIFTVRNM